MAKEKLAKKRTIKEKATYGGEEQGARRSR